MKSWKLIAAISATILLIVSLAVLNREDGEVTENSHVSSDQSSASLFSQPNQKSEEGIGPSRSLAPGPPNSDTVQSPVTQTANAVSSSAVKGSVNCSNEWWEGSEDETSNASVASLNGNESDVHHSKSSVTATGGVDKSACLRTAIALKRAWAIFDVTSTQAIWYGTTARSGGTDLKENILPELCSGNEPFDPPLDADFELVVITDKSTTKILLGKYWVSDGTVWSQISEEQYRKISSGLLYRQRLGIQDGNFTRAQFDERLKKQVFNRRAAEAFAGWTREAELRRVQSGKAARCTR